MKTCSQKQSYIQITLAMEKLLNIACVTLAGYDPEVILPTSETMTYDSWQIRDNIEFIVEYSNETVIVWDFL